MDGPKAKPVMLPEVSITGKKPDPKKYRTVTKEKVSVYPNGAIDKSKVDSLIKAGRGSMIGQPVKQAGKADMYSAEQGDIMRKLIRK